MQTISKNEVLYSIVDKQHQFADLATLVKAGMPDPDMASGEWNGYLYAVKVENIPGKRPMFEAFACPKNAGKTSAENHSYYSNETLGGNVYEVEGPEPPTVTAEGRVPTAGRPREDESARP